MNGLALSLLLIAVEPYLPLGVRTYEFRSASADVVRVDVIAVEVEGGPGIVRSTTAKVQTVESFDPEAGLLVHRFLRRGLTELVYERPLAILPATMEIGALHTSQRRFVRRLGSRKIDVGSHYAEAELQGVEEVSTPKGSFSDCLKIRRHETRMDFSGTQEVYDATEWYARGVGLVRAQGERVEKDAEGGVRTREVIDLTLLSTGEP